MFIYFSSICSPEEIEEQADEASEEQIDEK